MIRWYDYFIIYGWSNAILVIMKFMYLDPAAFGIIGAVIWYGMMAAVESASQGTMSLTYFGDESGVNQCKITNKKFKCKKL